MSINCTSNCGQRMLLSYGNLNISVSCRISMSCQWLVAAFTVFLYPKMVSHPYNYQLLVLERWQNHYISLYCAFCIVHVSLTVHCFFIWGLQTSCLNCGGSDNVTYDWTFEPANANNLVQTIDWEAYSVVDQSDGSISIDVMAFRHVTLVEDYAFVLAGVYTRLWSMTQ